MSLHRKYAKHILENKQDLVLSMAIFLINDIFAIKNDAQRIAVASLPPKE